jgi:hypothetical protein
LQRRLLLLPYLLVRLQTKVLNGNNGQTMHGYA